MHRALVRGEARKGQLGFDIEETNLAASRRGELIVGSEGEGSQLDLGVNRSESLALLGGVERDFLLERAETATVLPSGLTDTSGTIRNGRPALGRGPRGPGSRAARWCCSYPRGSPPWVRRRSGVRGEFDFRPGELRSQGSSVAGRTGGTRIAPKILRPGIFKAFSRVPVSGSKRRTPWKSGATTARLSSVAERDEDR